MQTQQVRQKRLGWNESDVELTTPRTLEECPEIKRGEIKGKEIPLFFATDNNYLPLQPLKLFYEYLH